MMTHHDDYPGIVHIGKEVLEFSVQVSDRKAARIVVKPTGLVEVRVPHSTTPQWVEDFVHRKAWWIIKQRDYFESFRPRDPELQYRSGETIRYLGRQYLLKVKPSDTAMAKLLGKHLVIDTPNPDSRRAVELLVRDWFRSGAKRVLVNRAAQWGEKVSIHGIESPEVALRSMKRRWGSCTPAKKILLNPTLVSMPINCIDYVIVHEFCHLKYQAHDQRFYQLLSTVMPDWPRRRARLQSMGNHLAI